MQNKSAFFIAFTAEDGNAGDRSDEDWEQLDDNYQHREFLSQMRKVSFQEAPMLTY